MNSLPLLLLLLAVSEAVDLRIEDEDVKVDYSKMHLCPFPDPDQISPCKCYGDSLYRINLICHLQTDLQADLLSTISRSFSCKSIHYLEFNLGGHKWSAGFSGEHFSNLAMEKIVIRNVSSVEGDWFTGNVFNSSTSTLREFVMEPSSSNGRGIVSRGAFTGLHKLTLVKLGNNFGTIGTKSFDNCPVLETLEISRDSISTIETEAFNGLNKLTKIDLSLVTSHQKFTYLPKKVISNCGNLREVDLSQNSLMILQDDTFFNLTLTNLNLSNNQLSILGNNIATLNNKELVVDLSNNNIRFMLESEWRPYIETRKSTGHCVLQGNPLSCSCDMRWILSLNYQWSQLFRGADCQDGRKVTEVEPQLLDSMCPPPTCPGYNPILNTISSEGWCELYPEMTATFCGLNARCISSQGNFDCVCDSEHFYGDFLPYVGCSTVKGILITGGYRLRSTEIFIPATNESCNFVSLSSERYDHSQAGMEVFGGIFTSTLCDTWSPETGLWTQSQTRLKYNRQNHVSWLSAEGLVLLGGGGSSRTSEIISNETTSQAYFELNWACAIPYNARNEVFITGGYSGTENKVTRYGKDGFLQDLPTLTHGRYQHGCGGYYKGSQFILLVAGGTSGRDPSSSTEIFEVDKSSSWIVTNSLPVALYHLKSLTLDNTVYLTGGHGRNRGTTKITILTWDSESKTWTVRGNMKTPRYRHGVSVIRITDNIMKHCK